MKEPLLPQFKEFSDAVRDISELLRDMSRGQASSLCAMGGDLDGRKMPVGDDLHFLADTAGRFVETAVLTGERFYMPGDFNIIGGVSSLLFAETAALCPFPRLALLSELWIDNQRRQSLTACEIVSAEFAASAHPIEGSNLKSGDVVFASLLKLDDGRWKIKPIFGVLSKDEDGHLTVRHLRLPNIPEEYLRVSQEAARLINLFTFLSLKNVRTITERAPEKLNRKREARGQLPLFSFHVLNVAGDVWRGRAAPHADDDVDPETRGVRSHMRRGHIRRLDETRRVWVRAAFVHGSRPGFVDKVYRRRNQNES